MHISGVVVVLFYQLKTMGIEACVSIQYEESLSMKKNKNHRQVSHTEITDCLLGSRQN